MPLNDPQAKLPETEAINKECAELEDELHVLRARYEQFFMGVERQPPSAQYDKVRRRIQTLKTAFVRSTAVKFRVQSLAAQFLTYDRLWKRTLQEMENGTYRRDVFKAKLHQRLRDEKVKGKEKEPSAPAATATAPAAKAQAPGRAAAPPPASAGGLSDAKVKAIYDAYVTAKRQCKEDTSKLTLDSMAASLRKQVPELLKKHGAREVEFKVVVKDGKASLRAIPKT